MGSIEFYIIYNWMRDELKLADTELDCYAVIYSLSQSDNRYIAGVKRLMELLHKSEPTIIAALKALTEKGLVTKEPVMVNNIKRNYYKAKRPSKDNQEPKEKKEEKTENGTTLNNLSNPLKSGEETTLNDLSSINNINNKYKDNKKKKVLSSDNTKKEEGLSFDDFYIVYPVHKSKEQAKKAWNRLSLKDRESAYNKLPEYLSDCARCKRNAKHPSTYLNQRTWEDDFTTTGFIRFYDHIEGDSERKVKFKDWMRNNYPEIENTALPLSFEDGDKLMKMYGAEQLQNVLSEINSEIYKYRKSDIAQVAKAKLRTYNGEDEQ